jgi:hypothetical protein
MTDGKIDAAIAAMVMGRRVIFVCKDMRVAGEKFQEAIRRCDALGVDYWARKTNGNLRIDSGEGGIRFTSSRAELRGCSCDVLVMDEFAAYRDWIGPLEAIAEEAIHDDR